MDLTPLYNGVGVVSVVLMVGVALMRGNLVSGKVHREALAAAQRETEKAENRADRWEAVALKALHATECLAEPVAVASKVLTKLPSPSQQEESRP